MSYPCSSKNYPVHYLSTLDGSELLLDKDGETFIDIRRWVIESIVKPSEVRLWNRPVHRCCFMLHPYSYCKKVALIKWIG